MTKTERIRAERDRLLILFQDLDENQLATAAGLIDAAAFLRVSLEDLADEINRAGFIDYYENGQNQSGEKISAAVQAYAQLNGKYQSIMSKLLKIVPPAPKKPKQQSAEEIAILAEEERRDRVYKRQRQRDAAFLAACNDGTATGDTYNEFCAAWENDHAGE